MIDDLSANSKESFDFKIVPKFETFMNDSSFKPVRSKSQLANNALDRNRKNLTQQQFISKVEPTDIKLEK